MFKQAITVTKLNLQSVLQRPRPSLVIVAGIAGVVAVLVSMLAMTIGLLRLTQDGARDDRAIILSEGANGELVSFLDRDTLAALTEAPGIRKGADGQPLISPEVLITASLVAKATGEESRLPFRGVTPIALIVHPEIKVVEGKMFASGVREIVVGKKVLEQFPELVVGAQTSLRGSSWTVVGIFESDNGLRESEVVGDADTIISTVQSGGFQSATLVLESSDGFKDLRHFLKEERSLFVDVRREPEFFRASTAQLRAIVSFMAYVIGAIMAVGATFGASNTLYSAISNRSVEIATLRAIGFRGGAVVVSVLSEAVVLAAVGGLAGGVIGWLLFNGHTVSTVNNGRPLVFDTAVNGQLLVVGVVWAVTIGVISGLLPAIRAGRMPVASALRGT